MTETLATSAAALAAAGWRVIPLRPGTKLPMLTGWPDAATSDAATVAAWWAEAPASNIGAATGNGFFVLDVDTAGDKVGADSLRALIEKHGPLPPTLTVRTASGGLHHFFTTTETVRNSASRVGKDLDVRGAGGYVVVPPSLVGGRAYAWEDLAPMAPAPAWLIAAACAAAPVATDAPRTTPATVEPTPELLTDLRDALDCIPADSRDAWQRMGAALRPLGDDGQALWLAWSERSEKHDPERDPQTWHTFGHDSTGPGAVFAEAARRGWANPVGQRRAAGLFGQQPPAADTSSLRRVELGDVMTATVSPPRFVVHPLIPAGHLTLFGSHGGAGKSILALAIVAHVAAGVPWAGHAVQQCPVLFVSLEDAGDVVRYRLRRVIDQYGLDAATVAANLRVLDGAGGNAALMVERVEFGVRRLEPTATLHELRAAVGDAGLLVIDNASDAFDGDENGRRQVRTFVRELASLGHAGDAGVLLLAHIDKAAARFGSNGNSYSGSSAWHNSARSRLALVATSRGGVELVQEKLNLGKAAAPVALCWTDGGVLIPDPVGSAKDAAADADAVLAAIIAATEAGVNVPTTNKGRFTAQGALEQRPELPDVLRGTVGRGMFWAAVTDLQRAGRIFVETYADASRHKRERFRSTSAPLAESGTVH